MVEMSDIVSKLVELSGQNRVPWKSSSDESTFVAAYGDLSVMIISRGNEPADTITLAVFDGSGTIIDRASYNGPASFSGVSGPPNYGELKPLYESAKRSPWVWMNA